MSELVVGHVPLSRARTVRMGEKLARKAIFKVLGNLQVGSLTLHEGSEAFHFGTSASG